jgi:hypothetical protein
MAEVLFREGMAAFDAGSYAEACSKLEGAVSLTRGEALGGALALAKCYEKQGKTASAWAAYSEVAGKARASGQASRAAEAESGATALLPKLHYIALRVPPEIAAIEGAQITRQGKPLRREAWGVRLPADPGSVVFEVTAPGKQPTQKVVDVPTTPGETPVVFDPLVDAQPSAPPSGSAVVPAATSSAPPSSTPPFVPPRPMESGGFWSGPRVAGAVIAGLGVAGLGAGIALGAVAKGHYNDAVGDTSNCSALAGGGHACSDIGPIEDARSLGTAGTVTFFVGAGALVGGGLLLLLSPFTYREASSLPTLTIGRDGGAVTWTGVF